MVQAALHDQNVLAAILERKLTTIANNTFRRAPIVCDQPWRQIHAFDLREAETLESDQAVSASAEKFDDFGVARPFRSAPSIEAPHKLLSLLFRRFETQLCGFPGIGQGDARSTYVAIVSTIFH